MNEMQQPAGSNQSRYGFIEERELGLGGAHTLMQRRVSEILLVSSLYDSFVLEEDGQLGDRLLADYADLHLLHAPRMTRVSTAKDALTMLRLRRFDLVLSRIRLPDMDILAFCEEVKKRHGGTPVVVLAHDNVGLARILASADQSAIDHLLVWGGDSRIVLATIKLIEDRWNVDNDTREGMVRTILVVEDSVRRLSSFLPMIYTELVTQTRKVMAEGLNNLDKLLRMQARPKILRARDYEEATSLFEKYEPWMLTVISDVRFPREGRMNPEAGLDLLRWMRSRSPHLPVVLHSADPENRAGAEAEGSYFLDKNSPTWLQDLHEFFTSDLGFGDFVFRDLDGEELDRARNLREMERKIDTAPDESITYHFMRHHLSTWLRARGEHTLAKRLRAKLLSEFDDLQHARDFVRDALRRLRVERRRGALSDFSRSDVDPTTAFVRVGGGSLGGKGRGIAFLVALLARLDLSDKFPGVRITVPQSTAIGTDYFTRFLERNRLQRRAIRAEDDEAIARAFLAGSLDPELIEDLRAFLASVTYPLAVRSSSLAEDSLFQPFAGLYATYMIPNNHPDLEVRLEQLCSAIKLVYASTFYQAPKSYIRSTPLRIEEERMGVVIQRLAANRHGDLCYPNLAGVAQSYNFYPMGRMRTEEGLAHVALGLGKMVAEGGKTLRFSPARPNALPQFSTVRNIIRSSQTEFYALDMSDPAVEITAAQEGPLLRLGLDRAEADGTLAPVGSVFVPQDGVIRDGIFHEGLRLVTFAHVLKGELFPLAAILRELLSIGKSCMGIDVEIEFAVNLSDSEDVPHEFALVQCRPLALAGETRGVSLDSADPERALVWTRKSLGSGTISDIRDVVYVSPARWDASRTVEIAHEVGNVNAALLAEGRQYILIGLGRWGTEDHWLGIPVTWNDISQARVMVEGGTEGFTVEPSQGSHFFHNITAFQIGYLTVEEGREDAWIDWDGLDAMPAVGESTFVRHVRFPSPLQVILDGRRGHAAVLRPGSEPDPEQSG